MDETKRQRAMSRENSKFRILIIERLLLAYKEISTAEIIDILEKRYALSVDRKTIYTDMYVLNRFIPLECNYGHTSKWRKVNIMEDLE